MWSLLDLTAFLPADSLFCSSEDLLENVNDEDSSTDLCKFQGLHVLAYLMLFKTMCVLYRRIIFICRPSYDPVLVVPVSWLFLDGKLPHSL